MKVQPVGIIRSCYTEKFGIPRQPGLVNRAVGTIELMSPFAKAEMVKGLADFSHLWVLFHFHDTVKEGWKATVRPPGLGGQKRVGVFASRSPHRPNHIGLSVVRLLSLELAAGRVALKIRGGDFLDGTPVFDIKPYIPFSDAVEGADGGYSAKGLSGVEVVLSDTAMHFCTEYEQKTGRDLAGLIRQVLQQDPRPASQRNREKSYGIKLWDVNIRWKAKGKLFEVTDCILLQEPL